MARRNRRGGQSNARFWWGLTKLTVVVGLLGALAWFSYETGAQLSAQAVADRDARITELSTTAEDHADEMDGLRTSLTEAEARAEDFRRRYEALAPEEMRTVIDQARAKLAEGLSPERLAFVVSQAANPRSCSPADTRRFIARTPNYDGPNTWVRFDNVVTVTGLGEAGQGGRAEWFDTGSPVTLTFAPLGGRAQEVSGRLPLQHAMVFKGKEYRFTASPGQRGFVEVTADWCAFGPAEENQAESPQASQ